MKKEVAIVLDDMLLLLDFGYAEILVLNDFEYKENQLIEVYCITKGGAKIKRSVIVVSSRLNFGGTSESKYINLRLKLH